MTPEELVAFAERVLPGLRIGDRSSQRECYEFFANDLCRVAAARMAPGLQTRVPPEDPVNSACRSFFSEAQADKEIECWSEVFPRLYQKVLHKVADRARRHCAGKRDYRRELTLNSTAECSWSGDPAESHEVVHEEIRAYLDVLIAKLGHAHQETVLREWLNGKSFREIAALLDRTAARVSQLYGAAVKRLRDLAGADDAPTEKS